MSERKWLTMVHFYPITNWQFDLNWGIQI